MIFGDQRGPWGATPEDARQIFTAYAEAAGNFIDTANTYSQGNSERIVGDLIGAERDRWVLATKYTLNTRLEVSLSPDDLERLDTVSRIELGFPHDFAAAALAYGNTFDLIDNHRP